MPPSSLLTSAFTATTRHGGSTITTINTTKNRHVVSSSIQDRIWMLQIAQRNHALTKPPTNGIALVLPEPLTWHNTTTNPKTLPSSWEQQSHNNDNDDDHHRNAAIMKTNQSKQGDLTFNTNKASSLLCILPSWPGRLRRRRRQRHERKPHVFVSAKNNASATDGDAGTVRLLDEEGQGEWS